MGKNLMYKDLKPIQVSFASSGAIVIAIATETFSLLFGMLENLECSGTERNRTGSSCCTIRTWIQDTWPEIRTAHFCVQTSTNREPRQAYKTAEVGYSQLWAQSWVMLTYVLLDRTGNRFHIKISIKYVESVKSSSSTNPSKQIKDLSYL